jgi:hypothetical protein
MATSITQGALLVGSVPLHDADEVFRVVSAHLGRHLHRMPDGETGERSGWIGWTAQKLIESPQFVTKYPAYHEVSPRILGLRSDARMEAIKYPNLEYADYALASYQRFDDLQNQGVIPAGCRFQVSLGTPLAVSSAVFGEQEFPAIEPSYEAAHMREVQRILDGVPHDRLAIQWDVCLEVWFVDGYLRAPFAPVLEGCVNRLARYARSIPAPVELGFHFCYGDYKHEHLQQPKDISACVNLINPIGARVDRAINWIHMPVPIERTDTSYFQPLANLAVPRETEIYLGVIHFRDGADGARRRIEAAHRFLPRFGVATECGMGRRTSGRGGDMGGLVHLLDLHAEVAAPLR